MYAATILKRARTWLADHAAAVLIVDIVAACLMPAVYWWFSPATAIWYGLFCLIGFDWEIVALVVRVRELADRDPLTGAGSRVYFARAAQWAIRDCARSGRPVALAVLDCDDFKRVNERFGHQVGDEILIEVAKILREQVTPNGTVARLWGDAFGILLPGLPLPSARTLLERAKSRLELRMSERGGPMTFSIGLSAQASPGPIATADQLLAEADALMFAVKRGGRNSLLCRDSHEAQETLEQRLSPEFARHP
jgi:diguanylate cyclase (GGDEF)-like protein